MTRRFPQSLREALGDPLAADLRECRDGLDDGAMKTIAGLLGVPLSKLKDGEAVRARQRARKAMALAAVFAVLAVVAAAAAWLALNQKDRAEIAIHTALRGIGNDARQRARSSALMDIADMAMAPGDFTTAIERYIDVVRIRRALRRADDSDLSLSLSLSRC